MTGKHPDAVTADRGYGEAVVEAALVALEINTVANLRKGKTSSARHDIETEAGSVELVKWPPEPRVASPR